MSFVTVVEVRTPLENPGPHDARAQSDLAYVAATRQGALRFVADRPDYSRGGNPWCFYVYDVELDDPQALPRDVLVLGRGGKVHASQQDAWDACAPEPETPGLR